MTPSERDRLEAVLAAYGADPARWPAVDRALAGGLDTAIAAEAGSIDALLARASRVEPRADAANATLERLSAVPGNVVPFPRRIIRQAAGLWPAAALAASLTLGIYLGAIGVADDLFTAQLDDPTEFMGLGEAVALLEDDGP